MAKLTLVPTSHPLIRSFILGNSGAGKSTSLVSLGVDNILKDTPGYQLLWLDFDGKAEETVRSQLGRMVKDRIITLEQAEHALTNNYDIVRCRENTGIVSGIINGRQVEKIGVKGVPTAWTTAQKQLKKWQSTYSDRTILIYDSLTYAAQAAVNFSQDVNGMLNQELNWKQYSGPQQLITKLLTFGADVKSHLIILSHQDVIEITKNTGKVDNKGNEIEELLDVVVAPMSVGRAGRVQLPAQVNHLLVASSEGAGKTSKRYIYTVPTKGIDTKSPFYNARDSYEITKGMTEYFKLRESLL